MQISKDETIKNLILDILLNAHKHKWTLQGFGMLRTYLPDDMRLHVWDSKYQVPNVSLIHDHPWDFHSQIIAGALYNTKYSITGPENVMATPYMCRVIQPGVGLKLLENDSIVNLDQGDSEPFVAGESYLQRKDEIHSTEYASGTVTLVQRYRSGPDSARVFYPVGEQWVSGEPREAAMVEVKDIIQRSLDIWF